MGNTTKVLYFREPYRSSQPIVCPSNNKRTGPFYKSLQPEQKEYFESNPIHDNLHLEPHQAILASYDENMNIGEISFPTALKQTIISVRRFADGTVPSCRSPHVAKVLEMPLGTVETFV